MTRWSLVIPLTLLLGAAVTVAIALACARWSRPTVLSFCGSSDTNPSVVYWWTARNSGEFLETDEYPIDTEPFPRRQRMSQSLWRHIAIRYPNLIFSDQLIGEFFSGRGVVWMSVSRPTQRTAPSVPSSFRLYHMIEKQYGWPLLCLSSGAHEAGWAVNADIIDWPSIRYDINDRSRGYPSSGNDRMLDTPRVILWPGFIGNTLLFSAPWLLGMIGFNGARKRWRRRRGRCPACAYDLRGDLAAGCPECGWGRGV